MADHPVVAERGVLTAPAEAWGLAVGRSEAIRELAAQPVVSLGAADAAAARLAVSRRQVNVLVGRWRAGDVRRADHPAPATGADSHAGTGYGCNSCRASGHSPGQ